MLDEYDLKALDEARQRVEMVYTYHYGSPGSIPMTKKLRTILEKLNKIIEEEKK